MPTDTDQEEIEAQTGRNDGAVTADSRFDPLRTMPSDVPRKNRKRWEMLAGRAVTQYRAAVELKCLDCVAWYRPEATRCQITGCPLWIHNRRIFKKQG